MNVTIVFNGVSLSVIGGFIMLGDHPAHWCELPYVYTSREGKGE